MAKIAEEHLVIRISQLVKDGTEAVSRLDAETIASLEAVVSELAGDGCVVEVEAHQG